MRRLHQISVSKIQTFLELEYLSLSWTQGLDHEGFEEYVIDGMFDKKRVTTKKMKDPRIATPDTNHTPILSNYTCEITYQSTLRLERKGYRAYVGVEGAPFICSAVEEWTHQKVTWARHSHSRPQRHSLGYSI